MISVIIPIHTGSKYLEATVLSCLEQTNNDVELWLLHSEEEAITQQVEHYTECYPCVHNICYKDYGLIKAYNTAMTQASGDYIALLEGDHVALPQRFETQLEVLEAQPEVSLVCSDMQGIDGRGEEVYPSYYKHHKIQVYTEDQTTQLIQSNFVLGSTIFFRKELVHTLCPIPEELPQAYWWISVIASLQGKVHFVETPLVAYRESTAYQTALPSKKAQVKARADIAAGNAAYYKAFSHYFRTNKHHYLSVIQPMELRDTLKSTYSLTQRLQCYYSERTYRCSRKISNKERMKIQGYLWFGPYLMMMQHT